MSNRRPDDAVERRQMTATPRSPSEALEPSRGPTRRPGIKRRGEARKLSPAFKLINSLLTLIAVVLAAFGSVSYWVVTEISKDGPLKDTRAIVVPKGEGAHDIAKRLEADGIIGNQQMFVAHYIGRYLASLVGGRSLQLKAGEYEIPAGASLRLVSEILGEGKSTLYRVSIPEGLTSAQIVTRLKNDPNLTGDVTAVPAEGSLLPDTYKYSKGMTRQQIIDLMQAEQKKLLDRLWAGRQPTVPLKTPEEAIILASIIEKETGRNDERDRVAAVFVNRLRQNMRLQSDPTILYGLFLGEVAWGRPIYKSEIQQKTAHNTYQIDGLPPTPICNPGKSAIEATLNPAKSSDLYFVANGQGGHVFTQNLKDHNAAVAVWRKTEQEIRARQSATASKSAKAPAEKAATADPTAAAPPGAAQPAEEQAPSSAALAAAAEPTAPVAAAARAPASAPVIKTINASTAPGETVNVPLPVRKPKRQQ